MTPKNLFYLCGPASPKREIVRVEKNLNIFVFSSPFEQAAARTVQKRLPSRYDPGDGRRVEAKAAIFPAAELGLPTTADQDKYFAFQKIVERIRSRDGVITNPVRLSSAALIGILGKRMAGRITARSGSG